MLDPRKPCGCQNNRMSASLLAGEMRIVLTDIGRTPSRKRPSKARSLSDRMATLREAFLVGLVCFIFRMQWLRIVKGKDKDQSRGWSFFCIVKRETAPMSPPASAALLAFLPPPNARPSRLHQGGSAPGRAASGKKASVACRRVQGSSEPCVSFAHARTWGRGACRGRSVSAGSRSPQAACAPCNKAHPVTVCLQGGGIACDAGVPADELRLRHVFS